MGAQVNQSVRYFFDIILFRKTDNIYNLHRHFAGFNPFGEVDENGEECSSLKPDPYQRKLSKKQKRELRALMPKVYAAPNVW